MVRKTQSGRSHGGEPRPSRIPWNSLTTAEKSMRVKVLEVLRLMRHGQSLSYTSKQVGIDFRTTKAQLRGWLYKKRGRWKAKARDRISRGLVIYERGRMRQIVVNDSAVASTIGEYFNDTKKALESGSTKPLERYKKLVVRDAAAKKHKLETRLEKLKEIELSREEIEFGDIYAY